MEKVKKTNNYNMDFRKKFLNDLKCEVIIKGDKTFKQLAKLYNYPKENGENLCKKDYYQFKRSCTNLEEIKIKESNQVDYENLVLKSQWEVQTKGGGKDVLRSYRNDITPFQIKEFRDNLISDVKNYSPTNKFVPKRLDIDKSNILLISIPDYHVGRESLSTDIVDKYMNTISSIISRTDMSTIEMIVYVIGNDFFNSDNPNYTTTKGTQQFDYNTWKETWNFGKNLLLHSIEYLKEFELPIKVINVPGNHDCYSDDTEVLTKDGFKKHKELKTEDLIATINPLTLTTEYQEYTNYFVKEYSGKMLKFNHRNLNSIVTPKHRMFIRPASKDFYEYVTAESFSKIPTSTNYIKVYGSNNNAEFNISDDLLKLMAWINTDGSINKKRLEFMIFQSKEVYVEEIRDLLNRLGIGFNENKRDRKVTKIKDKVLSSCKPQYTFTLNVKNSGKEFLENLSKLLPNKYNTPIVLKECSKRQVDIYIKEFIKGDGSIKENNNTLWAQIYGTKEILDDLQALCVTNGYNCRQNINVRGDYELYLNFNDVRPIINNTYIEEIDYNGDVWCLTTPNSNFITRREGNVAVQGNCTRIFYLGDLIDAYYRNDQQVAVDNSDKLFKSFVYGSSLLVFEHGELRDVDYPLVIASEFPKEWGNTSFRYMFCGHLHHTIVKEFRGNCFVKFLPSLAKSSNWELSKGYKTSPKAEACVISKDFGLVYNININC